jgi:hypothetical protein
MTCDSTDLILIAAALRAAVKNAMLNDVRAAYAGLLTRVEAEMKATPASRVIGRIG